MGTGKKTAVLGFWLSKNNIYISSSNYINGGYALS